MPAPPPPAPAPDLKLASAAPERGNLLKSIQQGARLRKTVTNDRSAPAISKDSDAKASSEAIDTSNPKNVAAMTAAGGVGALLANGIPKLRKTGRSLTDDNFHKSPTKQPESPKKPTVQHLINNMQAANISGTRNMTLSEKDRDSGIKKTPPPKPLKSSSTATAKPPPPPKPQSPITARKAAVSASAASQGPPTLPPRTAPIDNDREIPPPRRASIPLPTPPLKDTVACSVAVRDGVDGNTTLAPPTLQQPARTQGPMAGRAADTGAMATVSWQFPSSFPHPPQHTQATKQYPPAVGRPCQLFRTVSQCPKPPSASCFEKKLRQLTEKCEADLGHAIKRQDFAQCMDLKGKLETLKGLQKMADAGKDITGDLEDIIKE